MAKKTVKKEKELITPIESEELKTNVSILQFTEEEIKVGAYSKPMDEKDIRDIESNPEFKTISFAESKKTLNNITMEELIAYKNGCELVCKHYENLSRLNVEKCGKFNEYNSYANMIINEIERRLIEICKN